MALPIPTSKSRDYIASASYDGGQNGSFLGANYQMDDIVVGIEGDLSYDCNEKDSDFLGAGVKAGTDGSGSVRGRVGCALDRALRFATSGWTETRAYTEIAGGDKDSDTINGWTVGRRGIGICVHRHRLWSR